MSASKEPYGTMVPRFQVLITLGMLGSLWMFTQADSEPMAVPLGCLCPVIFAILWHQRAGESSVSEDRVEGLQQLDTRRSVRGFVWLLLIPLAWFVLNGLQDMSAGTRSFP